MMFISSGPFASTHCPPVSSRIGRSSHGLPVMALKKISFKLASGGMTAAQVVLSSLLAVVHLCITYVFHAFCA